MQTHQAAKRSAPAARIEPKGAEPGRFAPRPMPGDAALADRQVQPPVHQFASLSLEWPRVAAAPPPNRTGLPDRLKAGIEHLSGFAMDDVRVHYNSSKPATVQALAYTKGTEIHVGPGQETHLPHEAWHVVQQAQGRVKPTLQMKGMAINDEAGLEREANAMGLRASRVAAPSSNLASTNRAAIRQHAGVVQEVKRQDGKAAVNINNVAMGNNFRSKHVAGSDEQRKACAEARYREEEKGGGKARTVNTTATAQAWRTAVNGCNDVLAAGPHQIVATVSAYETTRQMNKFAGSLGIDEGSDDMDLYTHTGPANVQKTLGVNVQNNQVGWRVFINHVHDAKNADVKVGAAAPAAAPAGQAQTKPDTKSLEEFPAL